MKEHYHRVEILASFDDTKSWRDSFGIYNYRLFEHFASGYRIILTGANEIQDEPIVVLQFGTNP